MQFKLDIELEREKSNLLTQTALEWNGMGTERATELIELRRQQSQLESSQSQLEQALEESLEELERFREAAAASFDSKEGFWKRFF